MKDDEFYKWLINLAIAFIFSFISCIASKDIILGILSGLCIFLFGCVILLFKKCKEGNGENKQHNEEITKKLELLERLESVGIKECDTYNTILNSTLVGLNDVKYKFAVMCTAASRYVGADNFEDNVKRIGVVQKDNVRFLLMDPESEEIKKMPILRSMHKEWMINQITTSLKGFKQLRDYLEVRFYPKRYIPRIRTFFIDDEYVLISFYAPNDSENLPELKIIKKDGSIEQSFYTPLKEIFEILWNSGTEVDWDKY